MYLIDYSVSPLVTNDLQLFGYKSGCSTTLCTGVLKQIVAKYIHNGSFVLHVFYMLPRHLISKAFVRHDIPYWFDLLVSCGLPFPVVCWSFLQGGVLSPVLSTSSINNSVIQYNDWSQSLVWVSCQKSKYSLAAHRETIECSKHLYPQRNMFCVNLGGARL